MKEQRGKNMDSLYNLGLYEDDNLDEVIQGALQEDMIDAVSHGILVSNLAYLLSKELGMDRKFCYSMAEAGMLHDIGKLKLSKYLYGRQEDGLDIEEMKYVRMHPTLGYDILNYMGYPKFVTEAVYHHHENYDGTGYPDNLSGNAIPLGARILRTCDVFAALVSVRPYRSAFGIEMAMELMIEEVKNFDMKIFLAFQRVVHSRGFKEMRERIEHYSGRPGEMVISSCFSSL